MESSEKILNNCDILVSIFRYLDFKDHLKLIKIFPQFAYAIVHGVWRLNNKTLYIAQITEGTVRLEFNAENNVMTKRSLTSEAIRIILQHTSMYIHKLELNYIHCLENIVSLKYHNLTELTLRGILVDNTHLKQVAENCINLQSLTLISYTNFKNKSNIRANVFGEMKALNKLEIDSRYLGLWKYFDVKQLFCLAHLKTLSFNVNIRDSNDNNESNKNSPDRVYNIESLTIGILPWLQGRNICFRDDLIRFKNLTKLSITFKTWMNTVVVDDNDLTQISNGLPKLCELSLAGCCFMFKEFPRMNNLMDLAFKLCRNIKLKTFDEIFRKLKLKSLSLVVLEGDGAENFSDYNYISNTLETLNIEDEIHGNILRTFFNRQHKFENVSKVRVEMKSPFSNSFEGFCLSHNFPNLQELIMNSLYTSSEDILHLKHLKVLQFSLFDNMSWSYLEILFKHPTLTHITIAPKYCQDLSLRIRSSIASDCCEGLTTKLEYLSLPSEVYERDVTFWSSFRLRNKLLELQIFSCDLLESSDSYSSEDNSDEF